MDIIEPIKYRTVVNDAACWPWEPMPEINPPTLTGLINYLERDCAINPEPLEPDGWRGEGYVVRYGYHKQFWLPQEPTSEEIERMKSWHSVPEAMPCPICTTPMGFTYELTGGITEKNHVAECKRCDIRFSRASAISYTPSWIAKALNKALKKESKP